MTRERGGLHAVGDMIDRALEAGRSAPRVGRKILGADIEEPEFPLLPPGCPVQPLGMLGQDYFFLDERGQLIKLDPQKIGNKHIKALFGRQSELCDKYWPRRYVDGPSAGEPKGPGQWQPELAADILMRACAFEGIFDPQGRVRGRGAHRGRSGELILHCGDAIFVGETPEFEAGYQDPGMIDGFCYPTASAIPHPDPGRPSSAAGETLLGYFGTWNWVRPLEDPMFLLGLVVAMMVAGWLRWRPHAWMTGSKSTGKSTLLELLKYVFDGGDLHTGEATEASLRQTLKQQTLPVFFDEIESEEDNRRNRAVIKLARLASSGSVVFRGGQDHTAHEFVVRSSFLFSSILVPPMLSQDRSRLAILELQDLEDGATAPVLDERELAAIGRALLKRAVDNWHRFEATLAAYRKALADHGHSGRAQDQFGTLLACADLALYDHLPETELLEEWGARLAVDRLSEKTLDKPDEEEAVEFLATTQLPGRGGDEPWPVAKLISVALLDSGDVQRERLELFGLCLVRPTLGADGALGAKKYRGGVERAGLYLAIANSHEGLARIFLKSRWPEGVWSQAFARVRVKDADGAVVAAAHRRVKVRYAGSAGIWSTLIPLAAIVDVSPES